MKRLGLLVLLLVAFQVSFAQNDGIAFSSDTWKEVLKKAKEENKLIFFDAYTSWCGPCRKLQNQIFPDKGLGDFYNKNFINVKFDMEKGEGPLLGRKFAVRVYPTLLFIDPFSEKIVNYAIGYKSVEQLIDLGQMSMSRTNQ